MILKDQNSRKSLSNRLLRIELTDEKYQVPVTRLLRLAMRVQRAEHITLGQHISLIFCSDQVIKSLNRRYKKKDKTTDVLSFTYADPDLLGEIYISFPQAARQAKVYGVSRNEEILRLFIHGMFHLLGYNHKTGPQRKKMESKERFYIQ